MELISNAVHWFNVSRASALIALLALAGIAYAAQSARAAKQQAAASEDAAVAATKQADLAKEQVALGRQQIDLLLRQIELTEKADSANRVAQRDALQPMVVVDIAPGLNDPGVFVLTITNVGPSVARNVQIKTDEMLRAAGPHLVKMHEWSAFTKGISTMPPGHRLQFFFDVGFARYEGKYPMSYTFVVDCEGPFGPAPQATYIVDLTAYENSWAGPTTLSTLVNRVERIARAVEGVSGSVTRLSEKLGRDVSDYWRPAVESSIAETSQLNDKFTTWAVVEPSNETDVHQNISGVDAVPQGGEGGGLMHTDTE